MTGRLPRAGPNQSRSRRAKLLNLSPDDVEALLLYREVVRTEAGRRLVAAFVAIQSRAVRIKVAELVELLAEESAERAARADTDEQPPQAKPHEAAARRG